MLDRLAYGTLLAAFQGGTAPPWLLDALAEGLGGVTLFGSNIRSPGQLRELTAALGDTIVSTDEEGGDVTRLDHQSGSRYPGQAALGAVDDTELTRAVYHAIGVDLVRAGVNLNMAPSADVNTADDNPVIGTRSFGNRRDLVARHTAAAVAGLQAAGVAACVKHFPGHGATRQDSHFELPTVDISPELLWARELAPFRAAIDAGTQAIMTAHVRVPALTGTEPATLSSAALTRVLRREMGFDGVVITDALDMNAISSTVGLAHGAVRSLVAGSDLLCLGPLPSPQDIAEIRTAIVAAVRSGELPLDRLEEAAGRVARLRSWLSRDDGTIQNTGRAGWPMPGTDGTGLSAARRAVRVEGTISLNRPLVVRLSVPSTVAAGAVPWGLPGGVTADPATENVDELLERARDRSLVLVVRDAHRHPETQKFVSAMLAARPDAALVEMGLPIWRPACDVFVATYGAARVNAQAAAELLGV